MKDNKEDLDFCCQVDEVHNKAVEKAKTEMLDEDVLYDMADLFKVFGDSTRVRILSALFNTELCVCDIASLLEMTKSAISHQLRILRQTKLVKSRKSGKEVFYQLADVHVAKIFAQAAEHVME